MLAPIVATLLNFGQNLAAIVPTLLNVGPHPLSDSERYAEIVPTSTIVPTSLGDRVHISFACVIDFVIQTSRPIGFTSGQL